MDHLSHTASASDLARLECELWTTQNGMWMRFVRAGFVVHVSGTCGASDLAGIECELRLRQNGILNLDVLLYDAAGMCFVHLSLITSAQAKRDLESRCAFFTKL